MMWIILLISWISPAETALKTLEKVRQQFLSSQVVSYSTEKTVKNEIRKRVEKGTFTISGGKVHWLTEKPKKTLQLFDGKVFYNIRYPLSENGKHYVTRIKNLDKADSILNLFTKKPLDTSFFITSVSSEGALHRYAITPKSKNVQVEKFFVTVNKDKASLEQIEYSGDLNTISIRFHGKEILSSLPKDFFKANFPKDSQVIDR